MGVGVSGQDREAREWDFLFKGIMFGWMRLREGEGQWTYGSWAVRPRRTVVGLRLGGKTYLQIPKV